MKILHTITLFGIFVFFYYMVVFNTIASKEIVKDPPEFRARLGTILYHTDTPGTAFHTYCYYPTASVTYPQKSGEYIIKRVDSYKDCVGWMGISIYKEGWWVSEKEKLWWENHYFTDSIADNSNPSKAI